MPGAVDGVIQCNYNGFIERGASHDHRQPLYDRASYFDLAGFLGGEGRTEESRSPEGIGEAQAGNSFWLGEAERPKDLSHRKRESVAGAVRGSRSAVRVSRLALFSASINATNSVALRE